MCRLHLHISIRLVARTSKSWYLESKHRILAHDRPIYHPSGVGILVPSCCTNVEMAQNFGSLHDRPSPIQIYKILQAKIHAVYCMWAVGEDFRSGVDRVAQLRYTWHTDIKVCTLHLVERMPCFLSTLNPETPVRSNLSNETNHFQNLSNLAKSSLDR